MAEAVFTHMVKTRKLGHRFKIDSAGTAAYHVGAKPDSRSAATCTYHKVPINHRARQVRQRDFDDFDYILCMDESNLEDLQSQAPAKCRASVRLLGEFSSEPSDRIIKDPYYGGQDGFKTNFDQVTRCSEGLLAHLGLAPDSSSP